MEYPAEYQGASEETLARLGRQQDHDADVDLRPPHHPGRAVRRVPADRAPQAARRATASTTGSSTRSGCRTSRSAGFADISVAHDDEVNKTARVQELIHAYRVRGHLMADTDPLEYKQRRHPDLDVTTHGLTLWDLDREFPTGGFGGKPVMKLRRHPRRAARLVLPHGRHRVHAHPGPRAARPGSRTGSSTRTRSRRARSSCASCGGSTRPRRSRRSCRRSSSGRSASASRAASPSSRCWTPCCRRPPRAGLDEVCIGMPHRGRLNVLANIAGKSYGQIFREFEGTQDPKSVQGSGDVKYHLGTEGDVHGPRPGETTKVYLAANPSHLEAVEPGARGHRPGQAGPAEPRQRVLLRASGPDARRRRLRGPGRRRGDAATSPSCGATAPAAPST